MAKKTFTTHGTVTAKDGMLRHITVVGEYSQKREKRTRAFLANFDCIEGREGMVITEFTEKTRNFTMAYAICNPEDEFSESVGVSIAKSRIKRNPIGTLTSTNCTMLNPDQCQTILENELRHISEHIEEYLPNT